MLKRWLGPWKCRGTDRSYRELLRLVLYWCPVGLIVQETVLFIGWFISENYWLFDPELIRYTFHELFTGLDPFGFEDMLFDWIESGFWERWVIGLCVGGASGAIYYCIARLKGEEG